MVICPECQKIHMRILGTEKLETPEPTHEQNFEYCGKGYDMFIVHYCDKCNVIFLQSVKNVYG